MHRTVERHVARWQALPLCCRYLVAQFESQELRAAKAESNRPRRYVQWVLGTLRTGESEVMGLWLCESVDWRPVMEGFYSRGVESIRFVVSTDYAVLPVERLGATVSPSIDHLLHELMISGGGGNTRLRRALVAADIARRRFRAALRLS